MRSIKLRNTHSALAALFALLSLSGCSRFIVENEVPVATVQLLMNGNMPVDVSKPIPYMGTPIAFTLNGSMSSDIDGTIVKYEWLRTDVPPNVRYDAGIMNLASYTGDPMPVASPQVTLGEGHYQFSLWVTDDEDAISAPATLEFTIETPTVFMPDAACLTMYTSNTPGCADCVCTPTAMMGCLDNYTACYLNPDPMFVTLCKAIVDCAREKNCVGAGCFMPTLCQAEITAGVAYMGGMDCMGDPAVNPCAAASAIGTCTNMGTCMNACTP
jgi:hypothetical protein